MRPKVHIVCTQHTTLSPPFTPLPSVFVSWVKNAWECGAINWKIRLKSNWIEILSPAQIVRTRKGRSAERIRGSGAELALHCTWMAWAWHTLAHTSICCETNFAIAFQNWRWKGLKWKACAGIMEAISQLSFLLALNSFGFPLRNYCLTPLPVVPPPRILS